jgi:hypothetical protein
MAAVTAVQGMTGGGSRDEPACLQPDSSCELLSIAFRLDLGILRSDWLWDSLASNDRSANGRWRRAAQPNKEAMGLRREISPRILKLALIPLEFITPTMMGEEVASARLAGARA